MSQFPRNDRRRPERRRAAVDRGNLGEEVCEAAAADRRPGRGLPGGLLQISGALGRYQGIRQICTLGGTFCRRYVLYADVFYMQICFVCRCVMYAVHY